MINQTIHLTQAVIDNAIAFLTARGENGWEGTGMIAFEDTPHGWTSTRFVAPDQRPRRTALGCSVEVTQEGKDELLTLLPESQLYLARLHSHPGEAFHSDTDDANPALTHQGAISIVAPYFGLGLRRGLDACAVYRREDRAWRELPPGTSRTRWVVASSA